MWALEEDGLLLGTQTRGLPVEDTNSDQISCALPGPVTFSGCTPAQECERTGEVLSLLEM